MTTLHGGALSIGRIALAGLLFTGMSVLSTGPASADEAATSGKSGSSVIQLPNGISPEDVASGRGSTFYVGSLANGAIYQGDFHTGRVRNLVPAADGPTTGLFLEQRGERDDSGGRGDRRDRGDRLWAAGGPSGQARVYDASTGTLLRTFQLAPPSSGTFISDAIVTEKAAYYIDAFLPQLYVLPLSHYGALPTAAAVQTVPLTGDVVYSSTPNPFNLNGLAVIDDILVSGQTNTGTLFTINPANGRTRQIPLVDKLGHPATVAGADGIAQRGSTLYIARNFPQRIAVVHIGDDAAGARLIADLADPRLDIPSSVAVDGGHIFALNARFTTPVTPDTRYDLVRLADPK